MKSIFNHLEYIKQFDYKSFFLKKTYQYFDPIIKIFNMLSFKKHANKLFDKSKMGMTSPIYGESITDIATDTTDIIVRQVVSRDLVTLLREKRHVKDNIKVTTVEEDIQYSYSLPIVPMMLKMQHQLAAV